MSAAATEAKPNGEAARSIAPDFFTFSEEELRAIREVYAPKATDAQFKVFIMEASRRRLMPGRQLFFRLQRQREYDPELRGRVWTEKPIHITGIDAFRLIAQRTGKYAGQRPLVWIYLKNAHGVSKGEPAEFLESLVPLPGGVAPYAARATVLRKDFAEPLEVVARWDAYVQTYKDNDSGAWKPNAMWARMGPEQLGKCAEALGLRKAFPEDLWGLYIHEEFSDDGDDAPVPSAPQLLPPSVAQAPAPVSVAPAVIEREATYSPAAAETPQPQAQSAPPVGDTAPTSPAAPPPPEAPKSNGATPEDVQKRFGGQIVRPASESGKKGGIWYLRNVLDKQGVKNGGELMRRYITLATGQSDAAKIKTSQWDTVLSVLDGVLRKDGPAAVVKLIQETVARGK